MPRGPRQDGLFEPGLFLQFFLAAQPIGRLIEQAIGDSSMSAPEYAVLSAIDELAPVTPADIARLTGVPVAHAAHVGPVRGETPLAPAIPWRTLMLGESQICDRDGAILARLSLEDGEGHVAADVELAAPEPLDAVEDRFWIPRMTLSTRLAWHTMNAHGALSYRARHARGAFTWQAWPAGDLPDEIPAPGAGDAPAATS